MKILIIGSGGREHTLAWKIKQSPLVDEIYAIPGNSGIADLGKCVDIPQDDFEAISEFVKKENIDLTVVGPEDPLANGIVDIFNSKGLKIFGPTKDGAALEGSKIFAKELMNEAGIPTAGARIFTSSSLAGDYLSRIEPPYVIKADGLCAGKGVLLTNDLYEAKEITENILDKKIFGDAGARILVEDYLEGEEASIIFFTDGVHYKTLMPSQDHKRIYEKDQGPNTGGMGAYAPTSLVTPDMMGIIQEQVIVPTLGALRNRGIDYKGIIYLGLSITEKGPMVLEYNVRFGDPEAQVIIPLMKNDIVEVMLACIENRLDEITIENRPDYAVGVVCASQGYPGKYEKGIEITGLDKPNTDDDIVFHAGVKKQDDRYLTNGGRVLACVGMDPDFIKARNISLNRINNLSFSGKFFRRDIGDKELARPKIGILIGSDSDLKYFKSAVKILDEFNIPYELRISSAHRTPERTQQIVRMMENRGVKVFIAGAGMAAHLAGTIAAHTSLPVIGIPIPSGTLAGADALLSTAQMPPGVPVACVGIGEAGAKNAMILAAQIIASTDKTVSDSIKNYRNKQKMSILEKDEKLQQKGLDNYLSGKP